MTRAPALLVLLVGLAACGRQTFTTEHRDQTVTVDKGAKFRVEPGGTDLSGPFIAGDAVKYLKEQGEFEAARKGNATITYAKVDATRRSITGMPTRQIAYTLYVHVE